MNSVHQAPSKQEPLPHPKQRGRQKWKVGALVATGVAALSVSVVVFAGCNRGHSPEKRADWISGMISSKLDLTENQDSQLNEIKENFIEIRKTHRKEKAAAFTKAKEIVLSDRIEEGAVQDLLAQRKEHWKESFEKLFPQIKEFHASLSADQKRAAVELIEKFETRMNRR